jgi:hypothetical protein
MLARPDSIEALKTGVMKLCAHYDLRVERNRHALRDWIRLFENGGDIAFANTLRSFLQTAEDTKYA